MPSSDYSGLPSVQSPFSATAAPALGVQVQEVQGDIPLDDSHHVTRTTSQPFSNLQLIHSCSYLQGFVNRFWLCFQNFQSGVWFVEGVDETVFCNYSLKALVFPRVSLSCYTFDAVGECGQGFSFFDAVFLIWRRGTSSCLSGEKRAVKAATSPSNSLRWELGSSLSMCWASPLRLAARNKAVSRSFYALISAATSKCWR